MDSPRSNNSAEAELPPTPGRDIERYFEMPQASSSSINSLRRRFDNLRLEEKLCPVIITVEDSPPRSATPQTHQRRPPAVRDEQPQIPAVPDEQPQPPSVQDEQPQPPTVPDEFIEAANEDLLENHASSASLSDPQPQPGTQNVPKVQILSHMVIVPANANSNDLHIMVEDTSNPGNFERFVVSWDALKRSKKRKQRLRTRDGKRINIKLQPNGNIKIIQ